MARSGFSLVEMLVVISIMATVTVAAFAGLFGVGGGFKLSGAGNRVSNLALLARQNSLAKNAMTALVMIANSDTEGDYRAFRLYEIVPRTDGQPLSSGDWSPIGSWEMTPDGVVVDTCSFPPNSAAVTPPMPQIIYHDTVLNRDSVVTNYQYVVFLPTGALLGGTSSSVRLVQGFRTPGSQVTTYTSARGGDGKGADYYNVYVLGASGRVKIDRP
ncbi:MAG: prepilin-type N-terminal cleavage/methylation domain-containing protein [Verrucomicrobia bacterium]|nr:prepilin-type N-terminal cleavage/methylation domain-containing protein [Verrucomicrobiota bacterium]